MEILDSHVFMAILFVMIWLKLGKSKKSPEWLPTAMCILGVFIAYICMFIDATHDTIQKWSLIYMKSLSLVFLPLTTFVSSFTLKRRYLTECILDSIIILIPKVLLSSIIIGIAIYFIMPYNIALRICLLLGCMLSATELELISNFLGDQNQEKLHMFIQLLGYLSDVPRDIIFQILNGEMGDFTEFSIGTIEQLPKAFFGGIIIGGLFGLLLLIYLKVALNNDLQQSNGAILVAIVYCTFYLARNVLDVYALTSLVTLGIVFARFTTTRDAQLFSETHWNGISTMAITFTYIPIGISITTFYLKNKLLIEAKDFGVLAIAYLFIIILQFTFMICLVQLLRYFNYQINKKEMIIIGLCEIHGPGTFTQLLISLRTFHIFLKIDTNAKVTFFIGGIIALMTTINALFIPYILKIIKNSNSQIGENTNTVENR